MCNDYRLTVDVASIGEDFADLKIKIRFGEGAPNLQAREDIKITDVAPIIRTIESVRGEGDRVQRRWSWPGPNKPPVYNFRSEGREFSSNRCLIVSPKQRHFRTSARSAKIRYRANLFGQDEPAGFANAWRS